MAKTTIPKRTWQYGKEFKITVVKWSYQEDLQVKEVAEMLDIHPFMLSRWRKEYREGKLQGDHKKRIGTRMKKSKVTAKEMTENARLKQENERLKKENDLLKKWQRYLSEQHQNDLDSSKNSKKS